MAQGYTKVDTEGNIANGNVIDAEDLNAEFERLETAFNASSGHNHDGTAGGGATISSIGPSSDFVVSATEITGKTANTLDVGTSGVPFKNGFFDGTLNTDILSVDETSTFTGEATFNGGLNGTLTGDLVGDVYSTDGTSKVLESGTDGTNATFTGDVTGDLTGDIKNSDLTTIFDSGSDASLATYYGTLINSNSTVILTPGSDAVTAQFEGNSNTADAWSSARTVTFGGTDGNGDPIGDVTGSFTIDGSGNISDVELTVQSTSVPAGSVSLGTDTSGDYVESVSEGTGITILDTSGVNDDGAILTISIPQAITTTSNVTFNSVTGDHRGDVYTSNGATKIVDTVNTIFNGTVSSLSNHDTDDLTDTNATNKYFTEARARAALSPGTGIGYDSTTGVISNTATASDATYTTKGIASFDSTDFTVSSGAVSLNDEAIQDIIGSMVVGNTETNISVSYNDATAKLNFTVPDFIQYSDLSVGTEAASGGGSLSYNNTNGIFTYTPPTAAGLGALTAHPNISAASSADNSGNTFIQDITVDGNGHITAITSAATPSSIDAVGTYAWLSRQSQIYPGTSYSSGLEYAGFQSANYSDANNAAVMTGGAVSPSGTWRCMGNQHRTMPADHPYSATLFLKTLA
jgi:hypothetical protein